MEQYAIKGGNPLVGEVEIGGAKNAALPILAASIMTDETVMIENVPDVRDTNVLIAAMESVGANVIRQDRHTVKINGSQIDNFVIDDEHIYLRRNWKSWHTVDTKNKVLVKKLVKSARCVMFDSIGAISEEYKIPIYKISTFPEKLFRKDELDEVSGLMSEDKKNIEKVILSGVAIRDAIKGNFAERIKVLEKTNTLNLLKQCKIIKESFCKQYKAR